MIGIYGGTFDPVHFGHLRTALEVAELLELDELRLLPAGRPPHRPPPQATTAQRLQMLRLALAGQARLGLDPRELQRPGPSYMVDTLASLRAELGTRPLALILGQDAFLGLDRWHRWRELPDLAHLVVMTRPGGDWPQGGELGALFEARRSQDPAALRAAAAGRIWCCPVRQLEISASGIRALCAAGRSPRYLLPDAVLGYIEAEGLYQDSQGREMPAGESE
ncbi:nicotinate-nucleotide adenylyltransferase [Thiohalobacter sp. IOR34]|uniref:nicotinate-nucleotide adenylyltransferase n=1 Tax=Thiohalobacter sp. IOR34 TaxID=3057176 RepID=UPI0025B25C45|nr:nicotinate-nucleotide adenylyltransferase [Thiohalobacter sp. IOR34]WJW74879.1 nicotinate-nucleotide adenylyltransferase [Thiohalobacter sp. IOR34]